VVEQFRRYKVGFSLHDLRHAWAAPVMGHSVAIHTRTCHHWMPHRDQQQAVNTADSP